MGGLFGGGGGGGGGSSVPANTTAVQTVREAPEIEARKLSLYDQAAALAAQPVNIPAVQVAAPSALQQQGFGMAGQTGVGEQTVGAGIGSILNAAQGPNINQFFNPYQSYVTDEITRQAQIAQNQLAAQSVQAGAFGGGRQGVAQAEIERARQANIGQAQAAGFGQALQAAQQQQQFGLGAGQALLGAGAQQQGMQQADIQSLLQAGGIQQQLGQQALEAQRQTQLQQAYEPYQRVS